MDLFELQRTIETFQTSSHYDLWLKLRALRFSHHLCISNGIVLKQALTLHDQDPKNTANLPSKHRMKKNLARLLFNYLSSSYSLHDHLQQKIKWNPDPYFSNSELVFGHYLRNFFIHCFAPTNISRSKQKGWITEEGEIRQESFFAIRSEEFEAFLDSTIQKEKSSKKKTSLKRAGAHLHQHYPVEVNISSFIPLYQVEVSYYYQTGLLQFVKNENSAFQNLLTELSRINTLALQRKKSIEVRPFNGATQRYINRLVSLTVP